jgi:hypothetical protein
MRALWRCARYVPALGWTCAGRVKSTRLSRSLYTAGRLYEPAQYFGAVFWVINRYFVAEQSGHEHSIFVWGNRLVER